MNARKSLNAAAVAWTLTAAGVAQAVPVQWTIGSGGNDHYYELITPHVSWTQARVNATGSVFLGMHGYLATITSLAENGFVLGLGSDGWLGGTDQAVEGDWRWADGPEAGQLFWQGGPGGTAFGFAHWHVGVQPNNSGGNEDYLHMNGGNWNDIANNITRGYYVEYSAAVPEPGSIFVLALGLAGLGAFRRRRE